MMNKSRRMMMTLFTAVLLILSLSLTACSKTDSPSNSVNGNNQIQHGVNPPDVSVQDEETKQGTGKIVGLMDSHSVEIEVDGDPTAFQMDASIAAIAEELAPNEPVEFEYVEKAIEGEDTLKQLFLTKLAKASQSDTAAGLPATKLLEVELEGMKEERSANLTEGNGYALYVFDIFTFDSKTDTLSMNYDPNYKVSIVKLPSDYNTDDLLLEAKEQLSEIGQVKEVDSEIMHRFMPGTLVFLQATKEDLTRQYIIKEIDGQGYAFELNIPHGEPAEGFEPLAYASLNSIVTK
ncbi:hypothetical protein [Paenibacillus lentus]|uniref:DUF4163 domain-containing protein n=1 Tax=Paenibacillus lentus TaxID=1338368 RepID=A0A3S8RUQ8_9BACL|nr:hypothetical protein [Paenibacillus lentus]AZK46600.1 hypothetical protein EIM92_10925 [Paenibacillus lentus]